MPQGAAEGGMPTEIHDLIADARRRLRAAGIASDEAALDARLLAQHVLGWDATRLLTHGDQPATDAFRRAYEDLLVRRVGREPLSYITGTREFWNLDIEVTPAVLVPRPETELLVEAALEHALREDALRILDVCTGSGCVAVALAREFPRASVLAADLSDAALAVAARNAARHDVTSRMRCVHTDLFAGISDAFDLVTANPPYVPQIDASTLQLEVGFEPAMALFAGEDGLQVIRRLIADAPARLAPAGLLLFEFGAGQDAAVARLVSTEPGLRLIELKHDLQDIPRVAVAQRV